MSLVQTIVELRALYESKRERSVLKELSALDAHAKRLIALSPFVVLATHDAAGTADASPRGGEAGFVKVQGDQTLWIPDAPGNNRLDTLENLVAVPHQPAPIGLLFVIPGMDETLRVNGRATLRTDAALLEACKDARRTPKLVIAVQVESVYLHCGKAFMRADLWNPARHIDRSMLPSMGEMMRDQMADRMSPDTLFEDQAAMVERYRQTL